MKNTSQKLNEITIEDTIIESCETILVKETTKRFDNTEWCTSLALGILLDPHILKFLIFQMQQHASSEGKQEQPKHEEVKGIYYCSQFWSLHISITQGKE